MPVLPNRPRISLKYTYVDKYMVSMPSKTMVRGIQLSTLRVHLGLVGR